MSDQPSPSAELPAGLLPSETGELSAEHIDRLWAIFVAIAREWGDPDADPMLQRSQWLEFVGLRVRQAPSYLEEYRNAVGVLDEWKARHGDQALPKILREPGVKPADTATSRLARLKKYVVDEFIRVWLATGGFRTYGAGNYNGYISGSRFAVRPPYRGLLAPAEVSASPPPRQQEGGGPAGAKNDNLPEEFE
jgi:hypothetical protein